MTINKADIKAFFLTLETEAEDEGKKVLALVGQFLRSTMTALAKDPVMTAALQAGFSTALSTVLAAVETGGASLLPSLAYDAAKALVLSVGGTAEHELIPIVAGELHAAATIPTLATPEHVNP